MAWRSLNLDLFCNDLFSAVYLRNMEFQVYKPVITREALFFNFCNLLICVLINIHINSPLGMRQRSWTTVKLFSRHSFQYFYKSLDNYHVVVLEIISISKG